MKLIKAFVSWSYDLVAGFFHSLQDFILERDVKRTLIHIGSGLACVVGVTLLCKVGLLLIDRFGPIIWERFHVPISVLAAIIAAGIYLSNREEPEPEEIEKPDELEQHYAKQNWPTVAHIVEQGLAECGPSLGLHKVDGIGGLESPVRVTARGGVFLYQLCAPKIDAATKLDEKGEEVAAIVLQKAIDRGLHNCDFDGVSTPLITVDGINYPAYMVDKVRDRMGYVTILVAQPSERYIKQRKKQQEAKMAVQAGRPPEDKDV